MSQTIGRPGILAANVGGNFPIDMSVTATGPSSDPGVATFAPAPGVTGVGGQSIGLPTVAITGSPTAVHLAQATADVTITATNSPGSTIVTPVRTTTVTATVLNPNTGLDADGQPFQTTVFVAIQGIVNDHVSNELLNTDLGAFLAGQADITALKTEGNGAALINPATNLSDGAVVQAMVKELPDDDEECINWLDFPGAPGTLNLAQTVAQSAEVQRGATAYDGSFVIDFDCGGIPRSAVKAVRFNHPDTQTFDGTFSPSETLHFVDPTGDVGDPVSGLTNVTTSRTFELVLIDTNVRLNGTVETGATDDFGMIVEVLEIEPDPNPPVVAGEFVFLSITGGFQGTDIDTLNVPPGETIANLIYFDLDNLHDVLGIRSIEQIIIVDAGSTGGVDIIEAFTLNPVASACIDCNDSDICTADRCVGGACVHTPNKYGDVDHDTDVDIFDLFCILNGFAGDFSVCPLADVDLEPCAGDGDVDIFDLFAVLNAFGGTDPCCGGLP